MPEDLIEETTNGPVLRVRVTPRAKWSGVRVGKGRIAVGVRAAAEGGKATREALAILAEWAGVARSDTRLASGATSRDKRVLFPTLTPSDLRKRISEASGPSR